MTCSRLKVINSLASWLSAALQLITEKHAAVTTVRNRDSVTRAQISSSFLI